MSVREDRPLDDELVEALLEAIRPVAPPQARLGAMRASVLERAHQAKALAAITVQPDEGRWQRLLDGVELKVLHDHGDAQSFLLRLAPGARLPVHAHDGDELCVVLEGTVELDGIVGRAGTFHLALQGSEHQVVSTPSGCLLFLRANLDSLVAT
jgi:anti-sigma factor ChrR (cupin superfamily)